MLTRDYALSSRLWSTFTNTLASIRKLPANTLQYSLPYTHNDPTYNNIKRIFAMPAHYTFRAFARSLLLGSLTLMTHASPAHALLPDDVLPDDVWFKGNRQSFNNVYYAAVEKGAIWIKPNRQMTGIDGPWQTIPLPAGLDGDVTEIAFDDEHILALNHHREVFTLWNGLDAPERFRWQKAWGLPFWRGPGITLPEHFKKWDFSVVSPRLDEYYVDPAGHHLPVGIAKVSHIIAIKPDGRNVSYNDPWLPVDWSYEICGPERGRFPIHAASASGSTTLVMGQYGDMYTRIYDFDLSGHDGMFKYSYEDQTQVNPIPNLPQPLYVLLNATQLPAFPWVKQPKIPGRITNRLSIHKIGKGVVNRILRVEGWNAAGDTGFYEKEMTDIRSDAWTFHRTNALIEGEEVFNPTEDMSTQTLLPSEYITFTRPAPTGLWARLRHHDWSAQATEFNRYCSPASLTLTDRHGKTLTLTLHHLDRIRVTPSDRGIGPKTLRQAGTIEIPQDIWESRQQLPVTFRQLLTTHFKESRFRAVKLNLNERQLKMTAQGLSWHFERNQNPF